MTDVPLDEDLEPPAPQRVAERALVLAAVACRGLIEADAAQPEAEELRTSVREWLEELGALEEAEPDELRVLDLPLGLLEPNDRINAGWRSEGLTVLAWSLQRASLPRFDQQCIPSDVANLLGFLEPRESTVLTGARLRANEEVEHWAETYLTVHWRLREFGCSGQPMDFASYVQRCEWGPLTLDELPLVDGDLAVGGSAIGELPMERLAETGSIVRERHRAFNWLLGFERVYSEVTTDT